MIDLLVHRPRLDRRSRQAWSCKRRPAEVQLMQRTEALGMMKIQGETPSSICVQLVNCGVLSFFIF